MKKIYLIISLICLTYMTYGQNNGNGTINGHEYVDLGLPSGLKWATCNVGAKFPEEYGDYFAWGEVNPKEKYTIENSFTNIKETTDISGNIKHDAATAKWGKSWRTPTKDEVDELFNNCTWEWAKQNETNGYKVTSKVNGNSIFIPAAGFYDGPFLYNAGKYGNYLSSTPYNEIYVYILFFDSNYKLYYGINHQYGRTVRPVSD